MCLVTMRPPHRWRRIARVVFACRVRSDAAAIQVDINAFVEKSVRPPASTSASVPLGRFARGQKALLADPGFTTKRATLQYWFACRRLLHEVVACVMCHGCVCSRVTLAHGASVHTREGFFSQISRVLASSHARRLV